VVSLKFGRLGGESEHEEHKPDADCDCYAQTNTFYGLSAHIIMLSGHRGRGKQKELALEEAAIEFNLSHN
jgi:hypothetical protein